MIKNEPTEVTKIQYSYLVLLSNAVSFQEVLARTLKGAYPTHCIYAIKVPCPLYLLELRRGAALFSAAPAPAPTLPK